MTVSLALTPSENVTVRDLREAARKGVKHVLETEPRFKKFSGRLLKNFVPFCQSGSHRFELDATETDGWRWIFAKKTRKGRWVVTVV